MAAKITMLAPTGSDEANIGTTRYHVDWRDNTIEAEPEHVQALISIGFKLANPPAPSDPGIAYPICHRQGARSASWGGQTFEPDAQGIVWVPFAAFTDLSDHGFRLVRDVEARKVA